MNERAKIIGQSFVYCLLRKWQCYLYWYTILFNNYINTYYIYLDLIYLFAIFSFLLSVSVLFMCEFNIFHFSKFNKKPIKTLSLLSTLFLLYKLQSCQSLQSESVGATRWPSATGRSRRGMTLARSSIADLIAADRGSWKPERVVFPHWDTITG